MVDDYSTDKSPAFKLKEVFMYIVIIDVFKFSFYVGNLLLVSINKTYF